MREIYVNANLSVTLDDDDRPTWPLAFGMGEIVQQVLAAKELHVRRADDMDKLLICIGRMRPSKAAKAG